MRDKDNVRDYYDLRDKDYYRRKPCSTAFYSLRKKPTFFEVATSSGVRRRLFLPLQLRTSFRLPHTPYSLARERTKHESDNIRFNSRWSPERTRQAHGCINHTKMAFLPNKMDFQLTRKKSLRILKRLLSRISKIRRIQWQF